VGHRCGSNVPKLKGKGAQEKSKGVDDGKELAFNSSTIRTVDVHYGRKAREGEGVKRT